MKNILSPIILLMLLFSFLNAEMFCKDWGLIGSRIFMDDRALSQEHDNGMISTYKWVPSGTWGGDPVYNLYTKICYPIIESFISDFDCECNGPKGWTHQSTWSKGNSEYPQIGKMICTPKQSVFVYRSSKVNSSFYRNVLDSFICPGCTEPDIEPDPPKDWISRPDLYSASECSDKVMGSIEECEDQNGELFVGRESCCDFQRCYIPVCNMKDTTFPAIARNEVVTDTWSEPEDKSQVCNDINGTIQESKINCKSNYQCVATVTPPPVDCEQVGSYVTPREGVFHEDINTLGVDFNLHYSSANIDNKTIAHGWSISSHSRLEENKLYLGSGSIKIVEKILLDNNTSVVKSGSNELLFNTNNMHIQTRDAYSKIITSVFSYDENNRLVSIDDRSGQTTYINRDSNGTVQSITAPQGQTIYLAIDGKNDLVEIQYEDMSSYSFEYENHYMIKEVEPNGNAFLHFFDKGGKIIKVIDAELGEWNFNSVVLSDANTHEVHRASGDMVTYKNHFLKDDLLKMEKSLANGEVIIYENTIDDSSEKTTSCGGVNINRYKLENMLLVKDAISGKRVLESNIKTLPSGLTKTTLYGLNHIFGDNQVLLKKETRTEINNNITTTLQDYNLSTMSVTSPEGRVSSIEYDKETNLPTKLQISNLKPIIYKYDDKGRVVKIKQGPRRVKYIYDARGNVEKEINLQNKTTTSYAYDQKDRLTQTIYHDGSSVEFSYDKNGNRTKLTTPTPTEHTLTYNGVNKRTSMTSPLGYKTLYSYDKQRRVTNITRPSGKSIQNLYEKGRVKSVTTNDGIIDYSYACGDKVSSISDKDESIAYSYDGELLTQQKQEGILNQTINYSYNNNFEVNATNYSNQTTAFTYDKDGYLVNANNFTIKRDPLNAQVSNISDGVLNQDQTYNQFGDLKTQKSQNFKLTLKRKKAKIAQKRAVVVNHIQKTNRVKKVRTKNIYDYTYDTRGRLTTVSKNSIEVENYSYDLNGNRLQATVNGVTTNASYTLDDNLEVYGDNTYRYDSDGYLIEKTTPTQTTTYTYNTLGALTQVQTPTKTINYHLNANNQRVAKEVNGTIVEKYLWSNLTTLLATYDSNDNLIQRFNYTDSRTPTSMTMNSETYYLHYDQVGTLKAVSDTNHNIIKEITYDTFGNILQDTNKNIKVPFGFAGGLHDTDTKLVHFGYREYDPYTGKWTTKDPIDFGGGDSNLYGYVLGDPVGFIDPIGLFDLGIGGGLHLGLIGGNVHATPKSITICGRFGPGLFAGFGTEATFDIPIDGDKCVEGNHHASAGLGGDIGLGGYSFGASASTGTSGTSVTGSGLVGASVGFSAGAEACYTYKF